MNFIKPLGIYQLFILQIAVTITEANTSTSPQENSLAQIPQIVKGYAEKFWNNYREYLCKICCHIGINKDECKKEVIAIPVIVFLFIFIFSMICLICCKCCCKKSCCKKKENDESDESNVDYNNFIMGPDGQMYSQMYQGEMMQPQMLPTEMMYPQMYQGQMFYPQMLDQEMQESDVHNQEMQQTVTQEHKKKRKKKKRSSKNKNTNDDALFVGYDMM